MAAECDHDIALQVRSVPAGLAAPNLADHCNFKQTTANSAQKAARRENLSEQENGHSKPLSNSPYAPNDPVQRSKLSLLSNVPDSTTDKNCRYVPKVTRPYPTNVGYSGVRL